MQYLNLPNAISLVRLLAAPAIVVLAARGYELTFLIAAVALLLTDWVDGRVARALNQQSDFGARLDAASDVAIYAFLAWGVWLLEPDAFLRETYWLLAVLGSYLLSLVVALAKFHCLPNYHTRLSKAGWFFVTVGVVLLVLDFSPWPLRFALALVTAANLESIAVTLVLREWRSNIRWLGDAIRQPERAAEEEPASSPR